MIEPAGYGAAISFGPNTRNFREIVATLRDHDGVVVVEDGAELAQFVGRCVRDPEWAHALGRRARAAIETRQGATALTLQLLLDPCGFADSRTARNRATGQTPKRTTAA